MCIFATPNYGFDAVVPLLAMSVCLVAFGVVSLGVWLLLRGRSSPLQVIPPDPDDGLGSDLRRLNASTALMVPSRRRDVRRPFLE
jgi:hypothetical protein